MKRSEINAAIADARLAFESHHWHLPPNPRWDVTGFGLGNFEKYGLVLVNLAERPEYCEKVMFARHRQLTPLHTHRRKQEDIICRAGTFAIRLVGLDEKDNPGDGPVRVLVNGKERRVESNFIVYLLAGERITLFPGVYHEFWPVSEYAIIGEVSTANDDLHDNVFVNEDVGRFEEIDEDEPPTERLLSD
ncbi:MAG: D-lyxose/D-mannose family sugar isomerase [bacterium]|nr:D-lyxose/D-mannose family sugar isomerase [Candidatus Sumerlaeota bacterium]